MMKTMAVAALTISLLTACGGQQEASAGKTPARPLPPPTAEATTLYPDLVLAPVRDIQVKLEKGERRLRYSFVIVNAGAVPFYLSASRDTSDDDMAVRQKLYRADGTTAERETVATAYFAGDKHNHWHIKDLAWVKLLRPDGTVVADGQAKHGFCFYDTQRELPATPNSPTAATYTGCGEDRNMLRTDMALSPGWGDEYSYTLPDQFVDISGVPDGRYRLQIEADNENWFSEVDETNNLSWTDIEITGNEVRYIDFYRGGPVLPQWLKDFPAPAP